MPWIKVDGLEHPVHVRLCRQRRKRCKTCKTAFAELECDGCDKALCKGCAVSPRKETDFCPACFAPAWKAWLAEHSNLWRTIDRWRRRALFRVWALANPERFLELAKPLSEQAKAVAEPPPK